MGQVENVSVETDPAFDRALKAAVQRGGSDPDAVLNALVEELEITAPLRFSISGLGSGSAGQQGLDVVFQSGTNPNAAANNAATAWLPILRGLEGNGGAYSARASLVEVNGGYILAIGVKVEQPGDGGDEPEPVTLKSIAVSTNPTKTVYWVNETFDPAGMIITAKYSDNSIKTIDQITSSDPKGVSWSTDTFKTAGPQTVTISYGGKTAEVTVTVKISEVKEIKVTDYQKTYSEGDLFVPNGMKVTVIYADGKNKIIESITNNGNQGVTWDPVGPLTKEVDSVKITYTDPDQEKGFASANVSVTVQAKPVTLESITVSGTYKTKYISGESFNHTGMTITATYSDDHTEPVENEDCTYSPETLSKGTTEVTISYGGKSTTVKVTVLDTEDSYQNGTYSIATADGLKYVADLVNGGKTDIDITLDKDITLTGEWTPIGNFENRYTGTFDGNGHTITGLTVNQKERGNVGLIGYLGSCGKVQNLTLENVNLNGNLYVGGVVGYSNNGTVTACTVSGSINGKEYVGGIVGSNYLGTVTACYNTSSTVNGSYLVGGVVGQNNKGIVTACYNASGSIYGEGTVGGVVGDNYTSTVTACYWRNYAGYGIGNDTGDATKVDGTTVTWQTAVDAMNAALQNAGSEWRYELTGELPTLKK